jgi:hypothetical protein
MKKLLFILYFLTISISIFSQEELNTGIIYGENFVFSLTAPDGWVLDNKSGARQGLQAVFYRKGESWNNATTVMYANAASLENDAHKNLDQLIKYDMDSFKKQYSDLNITDGDAIFLKTGGTANIKYLSGNFEAIAYVDAVKNEIMIVMSSRTKEAFDSSKSAFEILVKSDLYIADKMVIETK